jgi:hypothetical protein
MMDLTEKQLKEIKEHGLAQFLPIEIAVIMGFDEDEFLNEISDKSTEAHRHYKMGRNGLEVILRQKLLSLIKEGDKSAIKIMTQYVEVANHEYPI